MDLLAAELALVQTVLQSSILNLVEDSSKPFQMFFKGPGNDDNVIPVCKSMLFRLWTDQPV